MRFVEEGWLNYDMNSCRAHRWDFRFNLGYLPIQSPLEIRGSWTLTTAVFCNLILQCWSGFFCSDSLLRGIPASQPLSLSPWLVKFIQHLLPRIRQSLPDLSHTTSLLPKQRGSHATAKLAGNVTLLFPWTQTGIKHLPQGRTMSDVSAWGPAQRKQKAWQHKDSLAFLWARAFLLGVLQGLFNPIVFSTTVKQVSK